MPKSKVRKSVAVSRRSGSRSSLLKKPLGDFPAFFSSAGSKALLPMSSQEHLGQLVELFAASHPLGSGAGGIPPASLTLRNKELGHDFFAVLRFNDDEVNIAFAHWGNRLADELKSVRLCGRNYIVYLSVIYGMDANFDKPYLGISLYPAENYFHHHPDRVEGARV
jgi:hypothetical protein